MPKPLPEYPRIALNAIRPASALIFYGGNKLTEFVGNKLYKHMYKPPAFHAALYLREGLFLNVGGYKTIQDLSKELASTQRVDVIEYTMSNKERADVCKSAALDTSKPKGIAIPDYGWRDYLRFGFKFLRPSKKDFCSENVAELLLTVGVRSSHKKPVDTAPWTLVEFAEANPRDCKLFTLHIGKDFKYK